MNIAPQIKIGSNSDSDRLISTRRVRDESACKKLVPIGRGNNRSRSSAFWDMKKPQQRLFFAQCLRRYCRYDSIPGRTFPVETATVEQ